MTMPAWGHIVPLPDIACRTELDSYTPLSRYNHLHGRGHYLTSIRLQLTCLWLTFLPRACNCGSPAAAAADLAATVAHLLQLPPQCLAATVAYRHSCLAATVAYLATAACLQLWWLQLWLTCCSCLHPPPPPPTPCGSPATAASPEPGCNYGSTAGCNCSCSLVLWISCMAWCRYKLCQSASLHLTPESHHACYHHGHTSLPPQAPP